MIILGLIQADNRYDRNLFNEKETKQLIKYTIDSMSKINNTNTIIISTYKCKENEIFKELEKYNSNIKVDYSSEENLSIRFMECIKKYNADIIVRCTGEQCLLDSNKMNKNIQKFINTQSDFYYPINDDSECGIIKKEILINNEDEIIKYDRYYKVFLNNKIKFKNMEKNNIHISFKDIINLNNINLYAGDIPKNKIEYSNVIGLSIEQENYKHIKFDVTDKHPLSDNIVDSYQAEDVFEHIEKEKIVGIINDIYRILKPKVGFLRLSIPDYRCDVLYNRSQKDENGNVIFDPYGGGDFKNGQVINGGHLWFPTYEIVKEIIEESLFTNYEFLHYYTELGESVTKKIDYSKGYIQRTPDNDERVQNPYRAMSIVVDCYKD